MQGQRSLSDWFYAREIKVFRNMSYTTGLMEINIYGNSGNKSRKDK